MRFSRFVLALLLGTAVYADVITLKSGRVINGTYLGGTARQIKVEVADQIEVFDVQDVARIEFGTPAATPERSDRPVLRRANPAPTSSDDGRPTLRRADSAQASSDDDRPTLRRADSADTGTSPTERTPVPILRPDAEPSVSSGSPAARASASVQLPAGTNLVVRMIDGVDSDKNTVGQTFSASVDEPVRIDGNTVIPRGSDAIVKLVDAKESGKFTGRTELTLSLESVKISGRNVDINTQSVTRESDARGAKTARNVGVGAVAGTVIGAIAGGGKGAAVGAAAGSAAGAGTQVVTKGQQVKIPSETRLTFVLDNPVTI
jgi:hypothetical protein